MRTYQRNFWAAFFNKLAHPRPLVNGMTAPRLQAEVPKCPDLRPVLAPRADIGAAALTQVSFLST